MKHHARHFKNVVVLLGLVLGTSSFATQASHCPTVDLRLRQNLPMRNQGDISWCYAHSTADYLQNLYRLPVQISAADLAIHYNKGWWARLLRRVSGSPVPQTGFSRTVLWQAQQRGVCPESVFPSERWTQVTQTLTRKQVTLKAAILEIQELQKQIQKGVWKSASELPWIFEFEGMDASAWFSLLKNSDSQAWLYELNDRVCKRHRRSLPGRFSDVAMRPRPTSDFTEIRKTLQSGRPVNIDYFYGVLNNQDQFERSIADLHTSVVLGQRWDSQTRECRYLVKNSYGEDCQEYDRRHLCHKGYLWIGESALRSSMTSFVYVVQ